MKRTLQNIAILTLFIAGWRNIWYALPFRYVDLDERILNHTFNMSLLALHHALYLVTGILMVIISLYLYQRLRLAWIFAMLAIAASLAGHLLHIHPLSGLFVVMDAFVFITLAYGFRDYHRKSPNKSIKSAFGFLGVAVFIYFAYFVTGFTLLRRHVIPDASVGEILKESGKALLLMDNTLFVKHSLAGKLFIDTSVTAFWSVIIISAFVIMRPLIASPRLSRHEKDLARPMVLAHGENPMAYLALEDDKQYFFPKHTEGLCAYTSVGGVMTLCGDIICANEDAESFMTELMQFADEHRYTILMMNITDRFKGVYEKFGFGFTKCGEDACFDLSQYDLKGGAVSKVRAAINHANKAGITVQELDFSADNAHAIRASMQAISDQWLDAKDAPELVFMLGKNNFDTPMDRRYFYAMDAAGKILAYCVFNPYDNRAGYIAEITRRKQDAPQGALEKIIYDAWMIFKAEGARETTLGLSPLYNVMSGEGFQLSAKVFAYLYENMSTYYDFKALHHAKEKFAPTHWKSRYYAYQPKPFSPLYAYAIVRSQMPVSLSKLAADAMSKFVFRKWFKDESPNN
jgi:phosphatidylglycerol lysyltransferase